MRLSRLSEGSEKFPTEVIHLTSTVGPLVSRRSMSSSCLSTLSAARQVRARQVGVITVGIC